MPYNPGVTYQGGELMARGISQAGNALSEGLQRYAEGKQESAALDTRFESTAKPLMEKLRLYGQLADENSPAAALLDKSADWHKLGTSQKKVLLADMMLLGDKTEAEQRRKQEDQWKLLAEQHHQAQEDLAQRQFGLAQGREGREAASALWNMGNQWWDNRRADSHLVLAQKAQMDTLARLAAEDKRKADTEAAYGKLYGNMSKYLNAPARLSPGEAFKSALGETPELRGKEPLHWLMQYAGNQDDSFFGNGDPQDLSRFGLPNLMRVPTGRNQAQLVPTYKDGANALPIIGPNGQVFGYGMPGRHGLTPIKDPTAVPPSEYRRTADHLLAAQTSAEKNALVPGADDSTKLYWMRRANDLRLEREGVLDEMKRGSSPSPAAPAASGPISFDDFQNWKRK